MGEKVRAAIYARISMDTAGEELGVTRQLDMARELITSRGWAEVGAYPDNSISAKDGKYRPQYTALCEAIARGEVDRVICYHLSRLWRNRNERSAGITLFKDARVSITSVRGPELDLQSAYGASIADLLGVFDTMESEVKSERVRDHARQYAQSGRFHGGGVRPFGYAIEHDRPAVNPDTGRKQARRVTAVRVHPEEGPIVTEAARRVLAGESLRAVAADLAERGITTSTGRPMLARNLRLTLASALISGRREQITADSHRGRPRPLLGEIVADGDWPAIISPDDSDRLRRLLSTPERRTNTPQARRTLLTGLVVCAKCGRAMVSRPRSRVPRYTCNRDRGGCGSTTVGRTPTDRVIAGQVLAKLAEQGPAMIERLRRESGADPDLIDRVRADEERLEALTVDYHDPEMGMSRSEYTAGRKAIMARLEANRPRLETPARDNALEAFVSTAPSGFDRYQEMEQRWKAMTDAQRRPVVASVVERILVHPSDRPGKFDENRLKPVWITKGD